MNDPHFSRTTTAFRPLDTTTALRPARLLCPACARNDHHESVLESELVDGTEFHRCKTCAGVWFHVKDLDTALRAASKGDWPQPRAELTAEASDDPNIDWSCPCCGGRLIDVKDRHGSGVAVHRCLICYGGWIEYPDLQRAEERMGGMLARLGRAVRAVLPS